MSGKLSYSKRYEYLSAEIGDPEPLDQQVMAKARLTVCSNAENAEDAKNMLLMLGLMPGQENEVDLLHIREPNRLPVNTP